MTGCFAVKYPWLLTWNIILSFFFLPLFFHLLHHRRCGCRHHRFSSCCLSDHPPHALRLNLESSCLRGRGIGMGWWWWWWSQSPNLWANSRIRLHRSLTKHDRQAARSSRVGASGEAGMRRNISWLVYYSQQTCSNQDIVFKNWGKKAGWVDDTRVFVSKREDGWNRGDAG